MKLHMFISLATLMLAMGVIAAPISNRCQSDQGLALNLILLTFVKPVGVAYNLDHVNEDCDEGYC
jgi:hypothetical protein